LRFVRALPSVFSVGACQASVTLERLGCTTLTTNCGNE
jgi:hypothetical protein